MKVCPRCGFKDLLQWRGSRFDFNADYMRFDEAAAVPELRDVVTVLQDQANFVPYLQGAVVYYRRGTGGLYLYRVPKEDFRVPRERKKHTSE